MSSQMAKLAAAGSFGIALVGLYLIFNSTNAPLSLSACVMFIVGTVVGVILLQPDK
jgi:multisubunit Na+/H+ antiporter MnhB subunit